MHYPLAGQVALVYLATAAIVIGGIDHGIRRSRRYRGTHRAPSRNIARRSTWQRAAATIATPA